MSAPSQMQAAVYTKYGPPEVLEIKSVPTPSYADTDVLVRVHYSTVNRTDCGFLRAEPFIVRAFAGLTKPKHTILGCEFSGEIVGVGDAVTDYKLGDRVFGFKDDDHGFGGHAQYTRMPQESMMAKIPEQLSYKEAAAGLEGSHYCLYYLRSAEVGKDQQILINGATGAIGNAALQLTSALGAKVTAVCAKPHFETIKAQGAEHIVDYLSEDFTKLEKKFDVVFDAVGKSTFGRCKPIMKEHGIYESSELGPYCQNPLLALWTPLFSKKQVHFPIPLHNKREDADYIASLMQQGQYKPLVDRTFALEQIVDAFNYVETGEKIGNVIIEIP